MADVDSLHDIESSDLDADPSAVEADAESEDPTEERFRFIYFSAELRLILLFFKI